MLKSRRVYDLPVNADVVDLLNPSLDDWNGYVQVMHQVLLWELELQLTGSLPSAVKDRGCSAHIRDGL